MAKNQNVYTFAISNDNECEYSIKVFCDETERNTFAKKWLMKLSRATDTMEVTAIDDDTSKKFNLVGKNLDPMSKKFFDEFYSLIDQHGDGMVNDGTTVVLLTTKLIRPLDK